MDKLLKELRRRNVFRVAGVYAVAGWVLVQVAIALETALSLPAWFDAAITAALLIGFPIALILAWAFEMTPEGMKLTATVDEDASIAPQTGRKLDYVIIGGLALVAVMIVVDRMMPHPSRDTTAQNDRAGEASPVTAADASIAVLPFADMSPAGDQEYFGDGIAEEILNVLAQIDTLKVASRTSAFAFRSRSELGARDIASTLGVRHILEGSVRTAGGKIRITAQLIDANTDQHLWSETFDRDLTAENIFAIQDEISAAITKELAEHLGVTVDDAPSTAGGTSEVGAYGTFLKGRDLFINRNYQNLPKATAALEAAVAEDPSFARAWGWLSMSYAVAPAWGFADRDYFTLADGAAKKALALDARNAEAFVALGYNLRNGETRDYVSTIDYYEQAIAADPQETTAYLWLSQAWLQLGFFDRAEDIVEHCLDLDPDYPVALYTYAEIALLQGRFDEAKQRLLKVFATNHEESYPLFLGQTANSGDEVLLTLMLRELADLVAPNSRWIVNDLKRALSDEEYDRRAALERFETRIRATRGHGALDPYIITAYSLAFRAYDRIPEQTAADAWWWAPGYPGLKTSEYRRRAIAKENLPVFWRKNGFPPQCKPVGDADFECE